MTHMVIFRSPEGKPGYHQADGLDDALRFVEMLRNTEQVTDARLFRMDEMPIEFRPWFKVEVVTGEVAEAMPAEEPATDEVVEPESESASEEADADAPVPAGVGAGNGSGRFGRFTKG
jgi:hypothetical protein